MVSKCVTVASYASNLYVTRWLRSPITVCLYRIVALTQYFVSLSISRLNVFMLSLSVAQRCIRMKLHLHQSFRDLNLQSFLYQFSLEICRQCYRIVGDPRAWYINDKRRIGGRFSSTYVHVVIVGVCLSLHILISVAPVFGGTKA